MNRLQTWGINLDRAPESLARIAEQLQRLGLPFTRLSAVDAQQLTPEQRGAFDEPAYRRKHGMTPVLGELGRYLSHMEAMRRFVASEAEVALILEDDVKLHNSLPAVLQGLLAVPDCWDMVKLSAVHSGTPQPVATVASSHQLAAMQLPYDHVFDQGWRFGLKVRLVTPTPCGHDDQVESTIGATAVGNVRRKFHWTKRLPAFAYRLGNELRREAYGLRETRREKRAA